MNTAPVPAASTSGRTRAMRSADHPEVPTRMLMPCSTAVRTTSIDTAGTEASTTRSAPAMSLNGDADVSVATMSNPGWASTTSRMMEPSLPVPPTIATRVVMASILGAGSGPAGGAYAG